MTMMPALPGFVFDYERNRYFPISKNHNATPSEAKYTQENLRKQEKKERAEKHALYHEKKRRKETVVRPYVRDHLLLASLDREMAVKQRSYSSYMHNFWPNACVTRMNGKLQTVVRHPGQGIRFFDRDPHNETIYAVHGNNSIKRRRQNPSGDASDTTSTASSSSASSSSASSSSSNVASDDNDGSYNAVFSNEYSFMPWTELARLDSPITSLTYMPSSGALAATTEGGDREAVVYLSDPDVDGPYVAQKFTPKDCKIIRTAAARPVRFSSILSESNTVPPTNTESLAVAASSSLRLFERSPAGDWTSSTALQLRSDGSESHTDVLALDWVSPTTVVLGDRKGRIHLYDTRSKGSSHILTNPFAIARVKRADDPTRIICAGLHDSLLLFDIRSRGTSSKRDQGYYTDKFFNDIHTGKHNHKKRRLMKREANNNWSQPILKYQHNNEDDLYLDIAVHHELGLLAAAQDSSSSAAIKVYNMWTGKLLKEIPQESPVKVHIKCLKFLEDHNGDTELWASWNGSIANWSFA